MTRALNGTIANDFASNVMTFCRCWEITKTDSSVIRLTDHDKDVTFQGNTHSSTSGFSISTLEATENVVPANADLSVLLTTNVIEEPDIVRGVLDGATVKIWLVNYLTPANYMSLPGGILSKVESDNSSHAVFELLSLESMLNQNVGRVCTPICDADVGDARCGVNLTSHTVTGTITSVTSNSIFTDSSRAESDDHFNRGKLTWTFGNNAGLEYEVKDFGSGRFEIIGVCPEDVQVGDTYSVYRGCDGLKSTCRDVFNNLVNHRGFPFNLDQLSLMSGPK